MNSIRSSLQSLASMLSSWFVSHWTDLRWVTVGFVGLLSFKWSDLLVDVLPSFSGAGGVVVTVYWIGFSVLIFLAIRKLRANAADFTRKKMFEEGSLPYRLSGQRILLWIIGVPFALLASASGLVFIYLANLATITVLALDVLVFTFLGSVMRSSLKIIQPTPEFEEVLLPVIHIVANVAIVVCALTAIDAYAYYQDPFITVVNPIGDPSAAATEVVKAVNHPSWYFQTLARFSYLNQLMIRGLLTIPGEGFYLYVFFYLTHLATLPAAAISILYKFCLRRNP